MDDEVRLKSAEMFMIDKHGNQLRKSGEPYYIHPLWVSKMLGSYDFNVDYQITGLFHDLLEDTDATVDEIKSYGNADIAHAVQLLTKVKGYIMSQYIYNICQNDMAKMTKLADRLDNLDPNTFKKLDWQFRKKYIEETEQFYANLYDNTPFFDDFQKTMQLIKSK
jgi:GTP pyrophosphokinase